MNIPKEITIPMIIFLAPRVRFFSFTLVQSIATNNTDNRLQDLNAITIGKLVLETAQVYVIVDTKTNAPHINEFLCGIATRAGKLRLYNHPTIHVTKVGKNTKIALSSNTLY